MGVEFEESIAQAFDALGNPVRRRIIEVLGEQAWPSSEIAERFECTWPAISRHLSVLEGAGLIQRYNGELTARHVYGLRQEGLDLARHWLGPIWYPQLLPRSRR